MKQMLLWDDADAPPNIDKSLEEILKPCGGYDYNNLTHKLKRSFTNENIYVLEIYQMYDKLVALPTMVLMELIQYFGTKKIKVVYDIESSGCETCDYGSRYGYTLEIVNPTRGV